MAYQYGLLQAIPKHRGFRAPNLEQHAAPYFIDSKYGSLFLFVYSGYVRIADEGSILRAHGGGRAWAHDRLDPLLSVPSNIWEFSINLRSCFGVLI